jgi:hypothetical protein
MLQIVSRRAWEHIDCGIAFEEEIVAAFVA